MTNTSVGAFVYRAMKEAATGGPEVGATARTLGVRPDDGNGGDIPVDKNGNVQPDTGGMSVAPGEPANLPKHRRPQPLGGTGKDPVWQLDLSELGGLLKYVQDTPKHGTVQPVREMTIDELQNALAATCPKWTKVAI